MTIWVHGDFGEEALALLKAKTGAHRVIFAEKAASVLVAGKPDPTLAEAEIASEIYVSVNTVKTHMRNIYTKLDAHNRGQAVEYARELGLLSSTVRSH